MLNSRIMPGFPSVCPHSSKPMLCGRFCQFNNSCNCLYLSNGMSDETHFSLYSSKVCRPNKLSIPLQITNVRFLSVSVSEYINSPVSCDLSASLIPSFWLSQNISILISSLTIFPAGFAGGRCRRCRGCRPDQARHPPAN